MNIVFYYRYKVPNAESSMAILDIGAISGFEPLKGSVVSDIIIKRREIKNERLILYFDQVNVNKMICSALI